MDLTIDIRADRLDCGHDLADIVEQVADGKGQQHTVHQRGCPHCRAALTELILRWAPLRDLAAEPVPVPAGLYRAVMRRLRRLAATDQYARWLTEQGATGVATWVLEQICLRAARRETGVAFVHDISVTPRTEGHPADQRPPLAVRLEIAATSHQPLPDTAAAVRAAVIEDLDRYAGLPADQVDIDITDVDESTSGHR